MDNATSVALPRELMRRVEVIADTASMSTDDLVNQIVRGFVAATMHSSRTAKALGESGGLKLRIPPEAAARFPPTEPGLQGEAHAE